MDESDQSNPGRVLRQGIPDILDELDRLLGLQTADVPTWVEWGRTARVGLAETYRRQTEAVEALQVILDLLGVDPENWVRSGGIACLLGPLIAKLASVENATAV